jgi:hypothetical protein
MLPAPQSRLWVRTATRLGLLNLNHPSAGIWWGADEIPGANSMGGPSLDREGNNQGFLIGGPRPGLFTVKRTDDFDVSDMALLPSGDALVLERKFSWTTGLFIRMRRIQYGDVRPGALVNGSVLFEADLRQSIDNMEGLSAHRGPDGETVLDPLKPVLLLPEVVDASKWLNGEHYYADSEKQFVFMYEGSVAGNGLHYNTGLVDLKEFKSYWDLLNPKWKGKILLFERPGVGSPSLIRFYHDAQLGPDFIKRLFSEMDVTVSQDRRQSSDWLASGKFPICIDCGDTDRAKQQGLPVDEFPHGLSQRP